MSCLHIKVGFALSYLVEFRKPQHCVCSSGPVEEPKCHGRRRSEKHIVETNEPSLEQDLTRESVGKCIPQLNHIQTNVLIIRVQNNFAQALVVPNAVHK